MKHKTFDRNREFGGDRPQYYEVFARKTSEDPLTHVGSIEAPNEDLAEARAWMIYDEHDWRELCLAPATAFIPITERGRRIRIKEV